MMYAASNIKTNLINLWKTLKTLAERYVRKLGRLGSGNLRWVSLNLEVPLLIYGNFLKFLLVLTTLVVDIPRKP